MTTYDDSQLPASTHTPEHVPNSIENDSTANFERLVQGMVELASTQTITSRPDFVLSTLQAADKQGMDFDDYRVGLVLQYALGPRENVLQQLSIITINEFDETYPGIVGDLVKWYIDPLLG